ncbi:MAG: hypothetical protein ACO3MF_04475 [Acholeplasmataceae bacterium]|jgi:hypothetical protein
MTDTYENATAKERGLIKHLSRRNYQLDNQKFQCRKAMELAVKMIADAGGDPFDYIEQMEVYVEIQEYSTIGDYINKKGFVSKAHYNSKKTYVGSVKVKGNKPILTTYIDTICRKTHIYKDGWFKQKPLKKKVKKLILVS